MSRSSFKGPFIQDNILRNKEGKGNLKTKVGIKNDSTFLSKTYARSSSIIPEYVGHMLEIHNGKTYVKRHITLDMVGLKLGAFSFSRRKGFQKKNKKKKR
jgi:small subunit ribosomal protein S19